MSHGQYTRRITQDFLREVAPRDTEVIERVLLYDFVTGRPDVLERHRDGIRQFVLPHLRDSAPRCRVWIGGIASRRGDARMNQGLAWARALRVEQHLRGAAPSLGRLAGRHGLTTTWHGERYSTHHTENSEFFRAVLIVISRAPQYVAPPPPPSRQTHAFDRFRIRFDWGYDGGEILAGGSSTFVIDYNHAYPNAPASDPAWYRFIGGGVGGGLPVGGGVGDPAAPWNAFRTTRVTTTHAFSGGASLAGRSAFGWGRTTLRIWPSGPEGEILVDPLEAPNSTTLALGASILYGPFFIDAEYTRRRRAQGA